ncbi:MAG: NAD(P)(+) transhydrogenase (Re/Si-specific) subunit beta [Rhodospirillales bacterium]
MGQILADFGVILALIAGIAQFRSPAGARRGNATAAAALAAAALVVLANRPVSHAGLVAAAVLAGSIAGLAVAARVDMIQIPALVAFQHGAGGVAALLVSAIELTRDAEGAALAVRVSGVLGAAIGAATFSGSMIAGAKLANRMKQTPIVLPRHNAMLGLLAGATAATAALAAAPFIGQAGPLVLLAAWAIALGIVFAIRIGGADMPVLISFLNATAGLAAAFTGVVVGSRLLTAFGAAVAASGTVLTQAMCKAMNRPLAQVFVGINGKGQAAAAVAEPPPPARANPFQAAVEAARDARRVVIIPGYGMAQGHAQFETAQLASVLAAAGKQVRFAVHPVAGRMPGHMHVLLAEAEVDPDLLLDLDDANRELDGADVAFVIGACDVVNPAAISAAGTPISGMPILRADTAKCVVVCNLDTRPGYSGVENPLYRDPRTILLLGEAKTTLEKLLEEIRK